MSASPRPLVLVVEDDAELRSLLGWVLRGARFSVREAADGRAAQEEFLACRPDVVISDLQMPELGGLELFAWIRSTGSRVPFIAMTGYGEISGVDHAQALGMAGFLTKPFDREVVLALLDRVLAGRRNGSGS